MTAVATLLTPVKERTEAARAYNVTARIVLVNQDVPRLIQALEAVTELHKPFVWDFGFGPVTSCKGCADQGAPEAAAEYPCPTITAVADALGGGE